MSIRMKTVAFTTDPNGKPIAYRWNVWGMRWCLMDYDEAKILVATGRAREVDYAKLGR